MINLKHTNINRALQKIDLNHDNKVSVEELKIAVKNADSNKDKKISETEVKKIGINILDLSEVNKFIKNIESINPKTVAFEIKGNRNRNTNVIKESSSSPSIEFQLPGEKSRKAHTTVSYQILPSMQLEGAKLSKGDNGQLLATYKPTNKGIGDNKTVYFFSAFQENQLDQENNAKIDIETVDEIKKLRASGYSVIVDPSGTQQEFKKALTDSKTAGIYWRGHGSGGQVIDFNGQIFSSKDIEGQLSKEKKLPSSNLKMVYFGACEVGTNIEGWQNTFGKSVSVTGYDHSVKIDDLAIYAKNDSYNLSPLGKLFNECLLK